MARARSASRSANPVNHDALVKEAKKGIGHSEAARNLGVTVGQISSMQWSQALVAAKRVTTIAATSAAVRKAKDVENNRWELIAARTGESMARVKELYGDADAVAAASARGKGNGESKSTGSKKPGRKPAAAKGKTATASTRRSRTRAERQAARSGNPS